MSKYYSVDQIVDKYTKSIVGTLKDQLEEGDEGTINADLEDMAQDILNHIVSEIKRM